MKKIAIQFIKNKYFLIWMLFFIGILFFIFNPILYDKTDYMQNRNITDYIYIYYVFLLPMSFYDMGFLTCFILDIVYFSIMSYVSVSFINLFFRTSSTITITRLSRQKWIKDVINLNLISSIIISLLYVIFFLILCIINDIDLKIQFSIIVPILYKIILTCITPLLLLNTFIKTDNEFISIISAIIINLFFQLIIKLTFIEATLSFEFVPIIIILLSSFYIILKINISKNIQRRDI